MFILGLCVQCIEVDFKHLLFITIIIALLNIVIVDFSFMFMYTTIAISRILICFVISYMIAVVFLCSDFLIFIMRNILSEKINSNPIYSAVIILSFVIICSIFLIKLYKYMKIFLLNKCFVKKYA